MSSSETRLITPPAILSYPHLDKPQAGKDGKAAKRSAVFIFPQGTDLTALKKAAVAAAIDKFGATIKVGGKDVPVAEALATGKLKNPFRTDVEDKQGYPAGSTFISARTDRPVGCVYRYAGADGKPEPVPVEQIRDVFYPGSIVKGSVTAFGYDRDGNRGVSFALNNVQKWDEGTRIDNQKAAEDDFTPDLSAKPADLSALGL